MIETQFRFPNYMIGAMILGENDRNLRKILEHFPCEVTGRGDEMTVRGEKEDVEHLMRVWEELIYLFQEGTHITTQDVERAIYMVERGKADVFRAMSSDTVNMTVRGKAIKPKTEGQQRYVASIRDNTITLGIGPAGTGKTFLSVALAAFYLKNREVDRIILTRPAVEAGEKLGYLPGDLQEKVDPYLRPLYDALHEMFGLEQVSHFMETGVIEVAPLAYMRGRTLERAFVILDEAQNTTPEQMKMFLTRLGNQSKMVINGDKTQVDLPMHTQSGLKEAEYVLQGIVDIGMVYFTEEDVVRHGLVSRIIKAYERHQERIMKQREVLREQGRVRR